MKRMLVFCCVALSAAWLTGCAGSGGGFLARMWDAVPFVGGGGEREDGGRLRGKDPVRFLEMTMSATPERVRLSDVRRVAVKIELRNRSRRLVQLQFPTAQRIELVARDPLGKVIYHWSEDRAFAQRPTYLAVNPRERVEWEETVSTREMLGGKAYTIEAWVVGYPSLKVSRTVVAESGG